MVEKLFSSPGKIYKKLKMSSKFTLELWKIFNQDFSRTYLTLN